MDGAMILNKFTECLRAVLKAARAKGTVKEVFSASRRGPGPHKGCKAWLLRGP